MIPVAECPRSQRAWAGKFCKRSPCTHGSSKTFRTATAALRSAFENQGLVGQAIPERRARYGGSDISEMVQHDPVRAPGLVCVTGLDCYEHNVLDPELSGWHFDFFPGDQHRSNMPCVWSRWRCVCLVHIDVASDKVDQAKTETTGSGWLISVASAPAVPISRTGMPQRCTVRSR